jgi:hypothetical protein
MSANANDFNFGQDCLKRVALADLEEAIAKAVTDLTGYPHTCSISKVEHHSVRTDCSVSLTLELDSPA